MTRVAVVGYGMAGRDIHVPLLREAGCEVVAVTTANPDRVAAAERDLPQAEVLPDLPALLHRAEELALDLVVLGSPSGVHAEQAELVIEAGLPLVVDKPLGVGAVQALRVVDSARGRVPLSVFQSCRFDPDVATLRRLVHQGVLGAVVRAEMRWERWQPARSGRWREVLPAEQGGGVLLDLHTHMVDAVVRLFGPVRSVYAELASRSTTAEDEAFLSCRHDSGVVSHLGASALAAAPGPRWRVLGTRGSYLVSGTNGEPGGLTELHDPDDGHCGWHYTGTDRSPVPVEPVDPADYYRHVARALEETDVAAAQGAMPVDPSDAVHGLAVLDAARVAARTGAVEEVLTPGVAP